MPEATRRSICTAGLFRRRFPGMSISRYREFRYIGFAPSLPSSACGEGGGGGFLVSAVSWYQVLRAPVSWGL